MYRRPDRSRIVPDPTPVTWDRYGHLYRDSEDDERDLLNAYIAARRTHGRTHDDEEPHE